MSARHTTRWEQIPIDVKVLIYPRNDLRDEKGSVVMPDTEPFPKGAAHRQRR